MLVDFDVSIFDREAFATGGSGSVFTRDVSRRSLKSRLRQRLLGVNRLADRFGRAMVTDLRQRTERPRILVIGGGVVGSGIADLYRDPSIDIVGTDVYASPYTRLVADGHRLPFIDESFDAVWIQAVLEHVLTPGEVVSEIHRVLRPNGLVYADTPFMQQVHEGAYDFTRFTVSGHRWIFRQFRLREAGAVTGAGSGMIWSLNYLIRAVTGSGKLGQLGSYMMFWLRFLDRVGPKRLHADAASGVYFYGEKSDTPIHPREMVQFYASQAG